VPDAGNDLCLPFGTDDADFRRGVEVGILWNRVSMWMNVRELSDAVCGDDTTFPPLRAIVHGDCAEVAIRIAEARNLDCTASATDDTWMDLTLAVKETSSG
jgi:hypothetical protein